MATGDAWAVDLWELYPTPRTGDAWAADAFYTANGTGMATMSVETLTTVNSREVGMATMSVDALLLAAPSPARLKRWDGNQWVPVRTYYYDTVTQSWLMNG